MFELISCMISHSLVQAMERAAPVASWAREGKASQAVSWSTPMQVPKGTPHWTSFDVEQFKEAWKENEPWKKKRACVMEIMMFRFQVTLWRCTCQEVVSWYFVMSWVKMNHSLLDISVTCFLVHVLLWSSRRRESDTVFIWTYLHNGTQHCWILASRYDMTYVGQYYMCIWHHGIMNKMTPTRIINLHNPQ